MARYYVYSAATAIRLQKMGISQLCHKCQNPIQIGEICVSIHSYATSGTRRTKIYHQHCYEKLYIDH